MGTTACSSGTPAAPGTPSDHDVQGEWARDYGGPLHPGISFVLSLTESGGRVGGTGGYTVEAGAPGTIVVSGSVAHDSLRLTMVLTSDPAPRRALRRTPSNSSERWSHETGSKAR